LGRVPAEIVMTPRFPSYRSKKMLDKSKANLLKSMMAKTRISSLKKFSVPSIVSRATKQVLKTSLGCLSLRLITE